MIKSYTDLEVYQRSHEAALKIHRVSMAFPSYEQYELGSQLRRATKSVPLNIAEGYGKRSSEAEFKRYLLMAIGSCEEVRAQLAFCKDLGHISQEEYGAFEAEYIELGKMLTGLARNWKTRPPKGT